jgi:hypothetical protein
MKELYDEVIVFPFGLRKFKGDEEIGAPPKTQFGDVITSVNRQEKSLADMSYRELSETEQHLEEAFDRYGISPKIERSKKHFERNKKGKGKP